MNMHNNVFLCIERIPKGCWHKIVALCLYHPLTWKRTWLSFELHIVDEIIKKINHHPLADVHPIATMGSVPHMLDTVLSHFVNTSKVCFCPVTDRERRPPRRSMSLPDSDLSIAVLFAESESLLSMGIFLHSDLNQNVFHALWGIPTCTGNFRCSKPFCILLYMLNCHKFQPGAKLLVNHLVDQSLGLGVKFSPTSSAHYAKLLRDLWTLCYQLLVCYRPESSHTPAPGQV